MLTPRPSKERGHFDHGWLNTYHTFSFAMYHDPQHMGFRSLRVMNEDRVTPGAGFGTHPHADMEILTMVLSGQLAHRDSMGNGSTLSPGEFQRMSAGTGLTHSEFNPSKTEPVHFYQIWLLPERKGIEASWEQKAFPEAGRENVWQLVASPDGAGESLRVHQDVRVMLTTLEPGATVKHEPGDGRHVWVQALTGAVVLEAGGEKLDMSAGDGAAVSDERALTLTGAGEDGPGSVMLFDLS